MIEKLRFFLDEEKAFFLKNNPYLIMGDGGHFDVFAKLTFCCIMSMLIYMIASNVVHDFISLPEQGEYRINSLIALLVPITIFPIYMLLSITNKKGILLGATKSFLNTRINDDKIKTISKHLLSHVDMKYRDIEEAIEIIEK